MWKGFGRKQAVALLLYELQIARSIVRNRIVEVIVFAIEKVNLLVKHLLSLRSACLYRTDFPLD